MKDEPEIRVTLRIPKGIYERLVAFSEANHGAPHNNIIVKALDKYLPKTKRGA